MIQKKLDVSMASCAHNYQKIRNYMICGNIYRKRKCEKCM